MPRQEHLPQAVGPFALRRRLQRQDPGPAALIRAWLAALAACFLLAFGAGAATIGDLPVLRVEVARGAPDSTRPPEQGWEPATLPDNWARRWPGFDGVAWYRLHWEEPAAEAVAARALRLDWTSLAAAIYVNGYLVQADPQLAEPLSRSWNLPRYWRLEAPLLRPGANQLWVRVSGLSAFQPGLGEVRLGLPQAMRADFERREFWTRSVHWIALGLSLVMGVLFGMLWLLRPSEKPYGWFSVFCLAWMGYAYNYLARSPWPFDSTAAFQQMNHLLLVGSLAAFVMFVFELSGRGGRWGRRATAVALVAGWALTLAAPPAWGAQARNAVVLIALGLYLAGVVVIVRHAWAVRRVDMAVLALTLLVPLVAGTHDALLFMGVIPGDSFYAPPSAMGTLLGSSFALTWRMVQGMRLIENFNLELQARVAQAKRQLADSLAVQHAVALDQTRMAERMNMVRDLHDGLGMTLSAHLHAVRGGDPARRAPSEALSVLQEVSDDLRLIIEASSFEGSESLAERLAPLRHRATRLLEGAGIDVSWHFRGLEDCRLDARRTLDFLRVLQEALANVLKHSAATRVEVEAAAEAGQLRLTVRDDGRGLPDASAAAGASGIGIHNMRARAQRLQGELVLGSDAAGTQVDLRCPLVLPEPGLPSGLAA